MKGRIELEIKNFIADYEAQEGVSTKWGTPLVGFADVHDPYILRLKEIISEKHVLPTDVLPEATIVISYFVPFTRELAGTNRTEGDLASPEWAQAYEETNVLLQEVNRYLVSFLRAEGYAAEIPKEAAVFDRETLQSNWSQRHFAKAAGLGSFGINNMLITSKGCCGRYSSIVTNLDVIADPKKQEEYCLYKKKGSCGLCVKRCPSGALTLKGYDRGKCYQVCMKNAAVYTEFGSSYVGEEKSVEAVGSEVCGKCVTGVPCTFFIG